VASRWRIVHDLATKILDSGELVDVLQDRSHRPLHEMAAQHKLTFFPFLQEERFRCPGPDARLAALGEPVSRRRFRNLLRADSLNLRAHSQLMRSRPERRRLAIGQARILRSRHDHVRALRSLRDRDDRAVIGNREIVSLWVPTSGSMPRRTV